MNSAIERLLTLRVVDVMQRHVVEVPEAYDMAKASALLLCHEISGAPVVDDSGRCVGILSAVDFMKKSCSCKLHQPHHLSSKNLDVGSVAKGEGAVACATKKGRVSAHMTRNVHSIAAEQTLLNAARQMCDSHIHRLPILDPDGHPIGFISSLDVVAALVSAIEE